MKKMLLMLGLLACVLALGGNSSMKSVMAQGEPTSLRGHVYGILTVSETEMAKVPEDMKDQRFAKEQIKDFDDGSREVKAGIQGWTVSVGRNKVVTNEDGDFYFPSLPSKKGYLIISFNRVKILQQIIFLEEGEENYQDVFVMQDIKKMIKSMGIKMAGHEIDQFKSHVPCNKNTFYCVGSVNSDCYKNLAGGNPRCWAELLNLSWPPRWCNGERNCSRFIGHKQEPHCDYIP